MEPPVPGPPGFDEILARLEVIAGRLERPDIELEEAITLYEEGVRLTRECTDRLRAAELRVEELRPTPPDDGTPLEGTT